MSVRVVKHDWTKGIGRLRGEIGAVDLVIADPPYNIGINYADDQTADRLDREAYFSGLVRRTLLAASDLLRPGGVLAWVCPADHSDRVWWELDACEFALVNGCPVIWQESFSQYQQTRLTRDYRLVFLAQKPGGPLTFNADAIRIESERQRMGDKRADPRGRVPGMVWPIRRLQGTSTHRIDWHPVQLPPELLDRLILGWSNPGGLVLDAFAGSGSAGVRCIEHGRRFIGVDRSATYARKMRALLKRSAAAQPSEVCA